MNLESIPAVPGERIKKLREKTGLSRSGFSYQTGLSAVVLEKWETGHTAITPEKAEILSQLLMLKFGIDLDKADTGD